VADQADPQIRKFKDSYRDEPTDMLVSHHVERFLDKKLVEVEAGEITAGRYESYRCEIEAFRDWVGAKSAIEDLSATNLDDYLAHSRKQVARKAVAAKTAAGSLLSVLAGDRTTSCRSLQVDDRTPR